MSPLGEQLLSKIPRKTNVDEDAGKTFIHCWWECKVVQPL
jgi:hypothetical protein